MDKNTGTMALLSMLTDALGRLEEIEGLISIDTSSTDEDGETTLTYKCNAERILDVIRRDYDAES